MSQPQEAVRAEDAVRERVVKVLGEMGVAAGDGGCETLLIRDGYYVGRHFRFESARAVWFAEANTFKFYGNEGQLLMVLRPEACQHPEPLDEQALLQEQGLANSSRPDANAA